jgi:protein TonB
MTQAAIYQPLRASPTTLAVVILLHGAALTALALAKMENPLKPIYDTTDVINVPLKPIPDVVPPERPREMPHQVTVTKPLVPTPPPPAWDNVIRDSETTTRTIDPGPAEIVVPPLPPLPPPAMHIPVRQAAQMVSSSELKPPYPISEQRAGVEGSVTVRVLVGPDGKVKAAEKVRATNDAFFQATLRHALRNWRFRPATVDGRPVESRVVLTLHFELDGEA